MFDDSGRILSQAFVVLDFVPGNTRFTTDDPVGMAVQMADVLAAIHALDATSASLCDLPLHADRMQGWVITDLERREPDHSLREDLVRHHLDEHWPLPATELCLLHADYFPGNIVWQGDAIAAVIDWESAALGDPMADLATTRLDLRWAYGAEIAERFTERYLTVTGRSTATLAVWELVVSLRPAGAVSLWASDMAAHGRSDITSDHHAHRATRLRRQRTPTPRYRVKSQFLKPRRTPAPAAGRTETGHDARPAHIRRSVTFRAAQVGKGLPTDGAALR